MSILWQLLLQVGLIALNAIFACAEIAVLSVSDTRLAQLAEKGDKKALRLARLTNQPARFLATIQVAITLSGFLGSAFAADNFSHRLSALILSWGLKIPEQTLNTITLILVTLLLSYFTLVFGELVPKRLAMKKAEKLALGLSGLIHVISKLFAPLVALLTVSTNGILRLLGIDPKAEDEEVSEEEIRMLVEAGGRKGVIQATEQAMIQRVFEFDDLPVGDFATHRTELSLLWLEESPADWEKTILEGRHSRYPVCGEDADDVVGVLNTKDYFRLTDKSRENVLKNAVRPAHFVPESLRADQLFAQMKKTRNHFAVVLDEYGGTLGIVTMNDLLEQLVGDLDDEAEAPPPPVIEQLDSRTWKIRGEAPLDLVAEKLALSLPAEDYETFGGLVFASHGFVPEDGSSFELDAWGLHIRVLEIREHRLVKALVCREA